MPQLFDQRYYKSLDEKKEFHIRVLETLNYIYMSSNITINNCFKQVGFDSGSQLTEDTEDDDIPLVSLFQELCLKLRLMKMPIRI